MVPWLLHCEDTVHLYRLYHLLRAKPEAYASASTLAAQSANLPATKG